jgi:hypothetical protein
MAKAHLIRHDVATEIDGKRHTGSYVIDRGVITVSNADGSRATRLGRADAHHVAKRLLGELVTQKR